MENTEDQGGHHQPSAHTSLAFRLRGLGPLESKATSPSGQAGENNHVAKADPEWVKGKIQRVRSLVPTPRVGEYLDEASSFLNQSNGDPDILGAMRSLQKGAEQGKARVQEFSNKLVRMSKTSLQRRPRSIKLYHWIMANNSRTMKELTTIIEAADKTIKELESNMEE